MAKYRKICRVCKKKFLANASVTKTCNPCRKRVCLICKKIFQARPDGKGIYCSRKCWNKRNPPIMKECLYCGKEFWTYDRLTKKYCRKKCYSLHKRELQKGDNSHFWRGGKTKLNKLIRTRAKYQEWRNSVFERDNWTCQKCGIASGIGRRVYLHAHHIKQYSEFPKLIYKKENGLTLCKNCHLLEHHHKF